MVETLHGHSVPDPYRWLEDPDSEETKQFVTAQNKLTQRLLSQCRSRQQFKDFFRKLYDYEKFGCPYKRGSRHAPPRHHAPSCACSTSCGCRAAAGTTTATTQGCRPRMCSSRRAAWTASLWCCWTPTLSVRMAR